MEHMMGHPIDPFRAIMAICNNTESRGLVDQAYKIYEQMAENELFGNDLFQFERIVKNMVHPPTPVSDNGGEEQLSDSDGSDSEADEFYKDIITQQDPSPTNLDSTQYREEANKNRDHISIIQDFICGGSLVCYTDGIPLLQKDERMMARLDRDHFLEIYFSFILSPLKYLPSSKAKRRFGHSDTVRLDIKRKRIAFNKTYAYVPEKHNLFYFRAERAMSLLLLRPNYKVLRTKNPRHVGVFFEVLAREVLTDDLSRVDMSIVFKLIQFFLLQAPGDGIKHFVKYHVVYELLAHCDVRVALETFVSLLAPGDNFLKIEDKDRKPLFDYFALTDFGTFIVKQLENFKIYDIFVERSRVSRDEKIKKFINNLDLKTPDTSDRGKNFLLTYFHSLFSVDVMTKFHKQPEDIYTKVLNIDRLPQQLMRSKSVRNISDTSAEIQSPSGAAAGGSGRFTRSNTIMNLEKIYDVFYSDTVVDEKAQLKEFDKDDIFIEDNAVLNLNTPKNYGDTDIRPSGSVYKKKKNINQATAPAVPNTKRGKIMSLFKKAIRVVMCNNLFLKRPQKKTKLKKKFRADYTVYPELINATHAELRKLGVDQPNYVEKVKLAERVLGSLAEVFYGTFTSALTQKSTTSLNQHIRLTQGKLSTLGTFMFKTDALVFGLLRTYLARMPLLLKQGIEIPSGYWAAKTLLLILKNL